MPTSEIKFHVLDVGQGACNFVEILNEDGLVSHIMLIDLGTNSRFAIADANVEWLREQIENNNKYLDVLILTHGDTDHYNLVSRILPAFGDPDNKQIGMIRYGGPNWRYGRGALITTLTKYTSDIGSFTPSQTSYDFVTNTWDPIWTTEGADDDPKLQLIVANTPHKHDPKGAAPRRTMNAEAVNSKSVITGLQWNGSWYVATGDATSTTLAEVNGILEFVDQTKLPRTVMLTLPHHGSRKTTYDLKRAADDPSFDARWVVNDFLDIFEPITMSISAGEKRHHHPSMYMINQFSDKLTAHATLWNDPELNNGEHFLTSWVDLTVTPGYLEPGWPPNWLYATTKTTANIFGTFYFKDDQYNSKANPQYICPPLPVSPPADKQQITDVPRGRNWEFVVHTDKSIEVNSTNNETRPAAKQNLLARAFRAPPAHAATAAGRSVRAALVSNTQLIRPVPQIDQPNAVSSGLHAPLKAMRAIQ